MQKRPPEREGAVLLAGERSFPTKNTLILQPSTVCELRALHLIANRHVRPNLALTLAGLAFGGGQ